MKNKKEKLILECIGVLGMEPDTAFNFVSEFPLSAYWSVMNAKGRKEKIKEKLNGNPITNTNKKGKAF